MKLLHVDSSILGDASVSRQLTKAIVDRLRETEPALHVTYHDLATEPLPLFKGPLAPPLAAALDELLASDTVVIGAPMYNFSIPAQLKTWLDALAVPGKTFRYGEKGPEGLLGAKRVIVASSRGGFYGADSGRAAFDHQETYLRAFFGFLGVTRFEIVRAEGLQVSPELKVQALQQAMDQVRQLEAA